MKGTILNYLQEYGNVSFDRLPMNDVDSLILCQLSYLKFDGMVSDVRRKGPFVTLKQIKAHKDFEKLFADTRYEKVNRALFEGLLSGKRFCNIRLNCYISMLFKESETQFSAITILLEDGTMYIAFRGTDETIVGWKEDFNMAYLSPVPSQEYSVKYLNLVSDMLKRPFYVGGHSKGGNLAVYSAMNCKKQVQERIIKIYSMDGPGFRPEVFKKGSYEAIAGRIVKILPRSSVIGMMFDSDKHYRVVESKTIGLAQHDPYTWVVTGVGFLEVKDIYKRRKRMDAAVNEWIFSLNRHQLQLLVDTLYKVVSASGAEDLIVMTKKPWVSVSRMFRAMREIEEQDARILKMMLKQLFQIIKSNRENQCGIQEAK